MKIGIDIDGVLFPWDDVARDALVARFGIPRPGPSTYWHFLKDNIPGPFWHWLWSAEGQMAVFSQVWRTYPGAVEAVNALLIAGHQVHFVTHRDPRHTTGHTAAFLGLHFGRYPWAGVHVVQNSVEKHSLQRWDAFVDDKAETVWKFLAQERARVFAPARLWNDELAGATGLVRYTDPREIVEALS